MPDKIPPCLIDGNEVYGYLHLARDSLTCLETYDEFNVIDREFRSMLIVMRTNLEKINDMILEYDLKHFDTESVEWSDE